MKKRFFALCAVILLGAPLCAVAAAPGTDKAAPAENLSALRAALQSATSMAAQKVSNFPALSAALKAIFADPGFGSLSEDERHEAYLLGAAAMLEQQEYQDAQAPIRASTAMAQADGSDWGLRFEDDWHLQDYNDAAIALTALAQHWPEKLSDYNDVAIATSAYKASGAAQADMLNAFYGIKWKPSNPFSDADGMWMRLIQIRLERGDSAGAAAVANELTDPVSFIELHADKRFDAIVQQNPKRFDVMQGFTAQLEDYRLKSAANLNKLEATNALAQLLLKLNQPDEAMRLIDDAFARAKSDPGAFYDLTDQINWTQDLRSRALFALGRSDEALASLAEGATYKEYDGINVSQSINLADEYDVYDRPRDALSAVRTVGSMSDYGRMALDDAKACAYFQLGDTANLGEVLGYMKAHASDGMQPYLNTMLCIGDLDGAAAEVIAALRDPERRLETLNFLQDYQPPGHPSKREQGNRTNWIAVRNRPDVAAEIAKTGHVNTYPVTPPLY